MQESLVIVGFRYFHPVEAISNHRSGTIWRAREGITETVIVIAIVNTSTWRMARVAHACSIAMTYQRINNSIGVKSGASLPAADSMGRLMNLSYLRVALHLHSSASKLRADIYMVDPSICILCQSALDFGDFVRFSFMLSPLLCGVACR